MGAHLCCHTATKYVILTKTLRTIMQKLLISSDLDGTLIDHQSYSFEAALPALQRCKTLGIPIVLNTSKTYQEAITIQAELDIKAPIIVENGSALYFDKSVARNLEENLVNSNSPKSDVKVFGVERSVVLDFINNIRQSKKWQFEGFNDWSVDDIASNTGLTLEAAKEANSKQYSEPFIWNDTKTALAEFIALAKQKNLKVLKGGRFYHLQGSTDKAKPLDWLMQNVHKVFKLEPEKNIKLTTTLICLGDNHNDVAMLNIADIPVCVRSPVADYPSLSTDKEIIYTEGFGPVGWSEAILAIIENNSKANEH